MRGTIVLIDHKRDHWLDQLVCALDKSATMALLFRFSTQPTVAEKIKVLNLMRPFPAYSIYQQNTFQGSTIQQMLGQDCFKCIADIVAFYFIITAKATI